MADQNRYYWLKFPKDFFASKRIKKLRSLAGGDTFTIIYLKMQLKSLSTNGVLEYTGIEPTFAEEIALDIDEGAENVGVTINYLLSCGLMETIDERHMLLPYVTENTGSETSSAERMRNLRERKKASLCDNNVQQSANIITESKSKRKSKNKSKNIYGEYGNVSLTEEEYQRLVNEYGEEETKDAVEFLDQYIQEKGYKSRDSNLTLRRWVFQAVKEHKGKKVTVSEGRTDYNSLVMNELLEGMK